MKRFLALLLMLLGTVTLAQSPVTTDLRAFDGSPFTSLTNYTAVNGLSKGQIVAGLVRPNTLSVEAGQVYTAVSFPNGQTSEGVVNLNNEATSNVSFLVRIQSGAYSGYKMAIGNNSATIYRVDAGTATQLSTVAGLTISNGDNWSFQASGSALFGYQNGAPKLYAADDTYTGGSPGFANFSSTDITHSNVTNWRGYGNVSQDGIWSKKGIVVPFKASDVASSGFGVWNVSNVLYESTCSLVTPNADGNCFRMWHNGGGQSAGNQGATFYEESNDGITWTRRSSAVLTNFTIEALVKVSGTYYGYGQTGQAQGSGNVQVYTSSDGITWALQNSNFLSLGGAGAWDQSQLYIQANPVIISGTWYFLYGGAPSPNTPIFFKSGIATSPDGITTATKSGSNPVLPAGVSGPVIQVGSTFYTWTASGPGPNNTRISGNAFNPTETIRYSSTDMINWSATGVRSLHVTGLDESVNGVIGGSTSCIIINVNGHAYNYFVSSANDSASPHDYQIALAIAPVSIENIVKGNEDAVSLTQTDTFVQANGDLSANWSTPTGGTKLTIVSNRVRATTTSAYDMMYYSGASFNNDQCSQVTVPTLSASTSFILPAVRVQSGSNSGYAAQIQGAFGTLQTGGSGIIKLTSGSASVLGSLIPVRAAAGDVIRLCVNTVNTMPTLTLYQNGNALQQVWDFAGTYTTGKPGIGINTGTLANTEISLWSGGNAGIIPIYYIPALPFSPVVLQ